MNEKKNLITETLKKKLSEEKKQIVGPRSSKLSEDSVTKILELIKKKYKLTELGEAIAVLALLFQGGGSARSCDGNMSIFIFKQEIKLADIRKILKEASCNRMERKLARSLADNIHSVSVTLELNGNLYKKIQRENMDMIFDIEERAWLSDFQADNLNCPIGLRAFISGTFQKRKKKD
jgi:hypothetical protein